MLKIFLPIFGGKKVTTIENLEEPRIHYISHKAKGVYANILLDDWFKRTFEELPSSKRLLTLLLQELIPERRIVDIKYAPQEHTNPNPDKRGIRVDVEATDADGTRFLVEMQRGPQLRPAFFSSLQNPFGHRMGCAFLSI